MKPVRHFLLIALVTSAICAESPAEPVARPQAAAHQGGLVTRLSVSLRRTVPAVRVVETRRDGATESAITPVATYRTNPSTRIQLSPCQFRLPPPAL